MSDRSLSWWWLVIAALAVAAGWVLAWATVGPFAPHRGAYSLLGLS